jgi:carbon monoxide dehydrogenase subunit G
MIPIDEHIDLETEPDLVWQVLADPSEVVACIPGATMGSIRDDGTFQATLTVRFGPTRVSFNGEAEVDLDAEQRTGAIRARGTDKLGGSRVRAEASFTVTPTASGSAIDVDGQIEIAGRLAPLIEGGSGPVVRRMSAEFAAALRERCSRDAATA